MKWILVFMVFMMAPLSFAQDASTATTAQIAASTSPTSPSVAAPAAPAPAISIPQAVAPPQWATELLQVVSGLPIVGPFISKALMYLGILGALLTALVMFLNTVATALKQVSSWAGLASLITWIQNFQQSKIMYWLTALSSIPTQVTMAHASAPPPPPKV